MKKGVQSLNNLELTSFCGSFLSHLDPNDIPLLRDINMQLETIRNKLWGKVSYLDSKNSDDLEEDKQQSAKTKDTISHYQTRSYEILKERLSGKMTIPKLLELAEQACRCSPTLSLNRTVKRNKKLLLAWFDSNWRQIEPVITPIYEDYDIKSIWEDD